MSTCGISRQLCRETEDPSSTTLGDKDDLVPEDFLEVWVQWRCELPLLSEVRVPRYYSPNGFSVSSMQLQDTLMLPRKHKLE